MYHQSYSAFGVPVTRRLSGVSEVELRPEQFGQPVDIELALAEGAERPLPNMPGYPRRSVSAAVGFIESCLRIGLTKFLIRIVDGGDKCRDTSLSACMTRMKRQGDVIARLRESCPTATLLIDPFGLGLGTDDQWGATDDDGRLSVCLTEQMFAAGVDHYAQAGAAYVLTLGRFPGEVAVAMEAIRRRNSAMEVVTFSTNSEVSQAYAYLDTCDGYRDSGQKVFPQNVIEMALWGLCDITCGASMVGIKPCDYLHVLFHLMQLAQSGELRDKFFGTALVNELVGRSEFVAGQIEKLRSRRGPLSVKWATYAISGVYATDMWVAARKGKAFLLTVLFERFAAIATTAALCNQSVTIFDRNARTFIAGA
jgi:delta-aminolevulinic acid dehydratase/porphobilinogen synthase